MWGRKCGGFLQFYGSPIAPTLEGTRFTARLLVRIILSLGHQHAKVPQVLALLRARRERPSPRSCNSLNEIRRRFPVSPYDDQLIGFRLSAGGLGYRNHPCLARDFLATPAGLGSGEVSVGFDDFYGRSILWKGRHAALTI